MTEKKIMLGNEAIARGAYEAGVRVSSAYPGTPSTEISEYLEEYNEVYVEWAPNEKVALEVAIGASMSGVRSLASMKHVGLNVAADPLFTASYIGVTGGLVVVVADDPGLYSSQNEQDTRSIAIAAKVPVLEPSDSQEAKDFVRYAFEISEEYDTPVILRTTTRLSHSQGIVELADRLEPEIIEYVRNPQKNVMVPANASKRHPIVEENLIRLQEDSSTMNHLNRLEIEDKSIGIITSGIPYQYVKEAMPNASILKLGILNPLPKKLIEEFSQSVDRLVIIEELDPVIENQVKSWGIKCEGKELFSLLYEYSANMIKDALTEEKVEIRTKEEAPVRPPILCPGCPHRSVYSVLNKLKIHGAGDIGCYTLGASEPLNVIDSTICMGASISSLHGMEKARGRDYIKNWVAIIGDSTFFHTGINSLINMVYNQSSGTVLILDNSTTAMTGHQDNPSTGVTLRGDISTSIDIKKICEGIGVKSVREISSFDTKELEKALKEELEKDEVSVIIAKSPCVLLKGVAIKSQYFVDKEVCRKCGLCMKPGCPAITSDDEGLTEINDTMCNGCGLCYSRCPFDAIKLTKSVIDRL